MNNKCYYTIQGNIKCNDNVEFFATPTKCGINNKGAKCPKNLPCCSKSGYCGGDSSYGYSYGYCNMKDFDGTLDSNLKLQCTQNKYFQGAYYEYNYSRNNPDQYSQQCVFAKQSGFKIDP